MKSITCIQPGERFLLIGDVLKLVPLSKPRIYALIAKGLFPEQVHLSENRVAWIESEILAWLNARVQERRCNRAAGGGEPALNSSAA